MAWSKSTRITAMLVIDVVFFAVELGVGIYADSLALLADAFHMLNDIISLAVGLWAVIVADTAKSDKYTYGWLRAEILGAFFNAVFLIALCISILLEAITRFIDPPAISNPKLILIVGVFGLASNILGFFVLGGHGHSHGDDHGHGGHDHDHDIQDQNGRNQHHHDGHERTLEEGYGTLGNPVAVVAASDQAPGRRIRFSPSEVSGDTVALDKGDNRVSSNPRRIKSGSNRHIRIQSIDDMSIHPASFRQEIIDASRNQPESESPSSSEDSGAGDGEMPVETERTSLLSKGAGFLVPRVSDAHSSPHGARSRTDSSLHDTHNHKKAKKAKKGGHGHNHADMGMNAMVLHVLGDMLGNVGVIATALVIWLCEGDWKYYSDPAVSVMITLIILRSCLPLTFATSKVLLQATPDHLDVSEIREDIESLPGVVSCHHIHIWQLSDTQLVASMHIHVEFPISEAGGDKYMQLSRRLRNCLHEYGIHSATIQPEFCTDDHHLHGDVATGLGGPSPADAQAQSIEGPQQRRECAPGNSLCLLECVDDCAVQGCCTSATQTEGSVMSSHSSHGGHGHGH